MAAMNASVEYTLLQVNCILQNTTNQEELN